jgi:hypothetical protein
MRTHILAAIVGGSLMLGTACQAGQGPACRVLPGQTLAQCRAELADERAEAAWRAAKYPGLDDHQYYVREMQDLDSAELSAEATIRNSARDPSSVSFKPMQFAGSEHGSWGAIKYVCGEVNAKNGFGGYTGYEPYVLTIDGGVAHIQLGASRKAIKKACGEQAASWQY